MLPFYLRWYIINKQIKKVRDEIVKKKLVTFLTLCFTLCVMLTGLTACKEQPHEHTYATEWSISKTHHWKEATCDCDVKDGEAEHVFVDGFCGTCGAKYLDLAFDGGKGTEQEPYIISNVEELANISLVEEFTYFKVKDGVTQLDLSNWSSIILNGSIDGNGVKLVNLKTQLFTRVGNYEDKDIYFKNFDITANLVSNGSIALIKQVSNFGTTTFENVNIHGYFEGESNVAILYSFGTKNGHATGSNYTVELKNVKSDATVVCVTAQPTATFIAHAFAGVGNKLTLKLDSNTQFTGEVYSAGDIKHNEYISIGDFEIYVDDQKITQSEIASIQITKVLPVKGDNAYTLTISENVSKVVVSITGQIDGYDENGQKIPTQSGITMTFKTITITENLTGDINVLDLFESAQLVNGADEYNAEIINGVLVISIGRNSNYLTGNIRLQVQQYNAENGIVSCGTLGIHTFVLE